MPRIALGLEYDGTDFVGWQAQQNGRSVQAELTEAVSRVASEPVTLHGAGRTDAGVHATAQVAHFDTAACRSERQWVLGINSNLAPDVAVRWAAEVPAGFDARRSALSRSYRYEIVESATRPALTRNRVWWIREALDESLMSAAAVYWLGERDFSAFRAAHCQSRTPMRHFMRFAIRRDGERLALDFRANAFLYHMVRNLVGALVEIGSGRQPPDWADALMAGRDRQQAAMTAPAQGLTLIAVEYPSSFGLPVP